MAKPRLGVPTAALVVGAAFVLSACASRGSIPEGAPTSAQSVEFVPVAGDPLKLVGSWQVEAAGQEAGSVLRLGDDLLLWSGCGVLMGDWVADHAGLFVAHVSGISGQCPLPASGGDPTPGWLAKVAAFKIVNTGAELLDRDGAVMARLTPGGHPTAGPNMAPQLAEPPTSSAILQQRLRPAAPLPTGLTPATAAQLVGRWSSADNPDRRGFAALAADGSWTGSDGANAQGGRWAVGPAGALAVVSGAQTLVGCMPDACVDIGGWLMGATRAGFDGSTLVLVDADGKVVGRLARAAAPPTPAPPSGSLGAPVSPSAPAASSALG